MKDGLLTESDKKAELSVIYVKALAISAGYITSVPEIDHDSIDLRVQAGGSIRPAIDFQLKATSSLDKAEDGSIRYRLKSKTIMIFELKLRHVSLLVLLELPQDESQWMTISSDELVL
ncbi:MAG: DUF4365 domain-containing protein [Gammaproteobacteria bacterium]|nr:DUF4365 domain-containing protein [Gammaproteobacteria bacterium]